MEAAERSAGPTAPAGSEPPPAFGSKVSPDRAALLAAPLKSWPRPSILEAPLTELRGAGPKFAAAAAEGLEIASLHDLLFHLPHTYRDPAAVAQIGELKLDEEATIEVEVTAAKLRPTRRRGLTIVEAKVADASGPATATWFNQAWLMDRLEPGTKMLLQGKLGKRGFQVASYEFLGGGGNGGNAPPGLHTTGIVPVHPASEGIKPQRVREWAWQAVGYARHAIESLPARLRNDRGLPGIADALEFVHFPASSEEAEAGRHRIAFEELLLYQAALAQRRSNRRSKAGAIALPAPAEIARDWMASLPFELTGDQSAAIGEIEADVTSAEPMQRLLMGEVGSGKTVVALFAMLRALRPATRPR